MIGIQLRERFSLPTLRAQEAAPIVLTAAVFAVLFYYPLTTLVRDWWQSSEAGHGFLLTPVAHSPRNCVPGSGWEIIKPGRRQLVVDGSPHVVNSYLLKNGSSVALTYCWYQGRGRVVASEYAAKWNLLRDAALFRRAEDALVLVMVPVRTASASSDEDRHQAHSRGEPGYAVPAIRRSPRSQLHGDKTFRPEHDGPGIPLSPAPS